jgi:hypothetical protein
VNVEQLGPRTERLTLEPGVRTVVLRSGEPESVENEVAVVEALARMGYRHAPRALAAFEGGLVREWIDATTALAVVPPPGSLEAAMEALAELHQAGIREGLDWERRPSDLVAENEVPLHRLGFAAHERAAADAPLAAVRGDVLAGPFGFSHRNATADHVLLAQGRAWLVGFEHAGQGAQLFDVAALLMTSGLDAGARARLGRRYAERRKLQPELFEPASIWWGLEWLLGLPRRLIAALGDDVATGQLRLMASRVERAIRDPGSPDSGVAALQAALWPRA